MKKLTPKSCGHKTVPLNHFQSYRIILESVDTIVYPHTNLYPTLYIIYIYIYLFKEYGLLIYVNRSSTGKDNGTVVF